MSKTSFKTAYGVLQKHADTLRHQQEPNIDDLLAIVTESVNAYKVCKERIEAVELALAKALGEDAPKAAMPAATGEPGRQPAAEQDLDPVLLDDDIPF